ncbi:MAG TPA: hypothetical protein VKA09_04995 [Nitrososphaeraceae archaeon]|nr:hypothetical protein [Nitrososphaeraceae archaeon]
MSHRLEKNADTKNIDYKEPKTSRSYSTSESDADRERKKQTMLKVRLKIQKQYGI